MARPGIIQSVCLVVRHRGESADDGQAPYLLTGAILQRADTPREKRDDGEETSKFELLYFYSMFSRRHFPMAI